jgi:hypothetical protein
MAKNMMLSVITPEPDALTGGSQDIPAAHSVELHDPH